VREHFFNTPELRALVADWTDDQVWHLNRGGHDLFKIFSAYKAAVRAQGPAHADPGQDHQGLRHGPGRRGDEHLHQQKKMDVEAIRRFRDRFGLPVPDDKLEELPYLKFAEDSPEYKYMMQRRMDLGGFLPQRRTQGRAAGRARARRLRRAAQGLRRRPRAVDHDGHGAHHEHAAEGQADRQERRAHRARRSRTFGMEGMFRQYGIWNQQGQKYVPEDHDQLMFYKEAKTGQVLQEGINEAGAMADWIAAGTAYSVHGVQMIPFYIFYSMFGLQRTMDLCWAAATSAPAAS
jgi:pyruvate dehydrogenase E1 component